MSKLKVFNICILVIILIAIGFVFINGRNKSQPKEAVNNVMKNVELKRVEKIITFKKNETQFSFDPVTVEKNDTENQMVISATNIKESCVNLKVYQDNKIIFNDTISQRTYTIPYKVEADKSTFKLELNYLNEIKDGDEEYAEIVWYVNKGL